MSRTRITLQDLIDRGLNPAGWQVTVDGGGNFVLTPPTAGGGGGGIGVYGLDEGVPLGTGTWVDWRGAGVDASISGTVLTISIPGGGGGGGVEQIGVYGLDDGVPLGTGTWINWRGPGVEATISGTTLSIFIPGEGADQIGIYGLDDGVPVGTGTWLDFGDDLDATISGTTIRLDVVHPAFPQQVIGVYGLDEGVPLGTGTWIDWRGDGVITSISGTVLTVEIAAGGGGGGGLGIMAWDEGIPLQTGTIINFVGGGVDASISGTVIDVTIPAVVEDFTLPIAGAYLPDDSAGSAAAQIQKKTSSDATDPQLFWIEALFDASTDEHLYWHFDMPSNYGSGLKTRVFYKCASATSGVAAFGAAISALTPGDSVDMDADELASFNLGTGTVPGTAGYMNMIEIDMANDDSVAPGDSVILALRRDVSEDGVSGDIEVVMVKVAYTPG